MFTLNQKIVVINLKPFMHSCSHVVINLYTPPEVWGSI